MEFNNIYRCHCGNGCPWLSCNLFVCFLFITTFIKEKTSKCLQGSSTLSQQKAAHPSFPVPKATINGLEVNCWLCFHQGIHILLRLLVVLTSV